MRRMAALFLAVLVGAVATIAVILLAFTSHPPSFREVGRMPLSMAGRDVTQLPPSKPEDFRSRVTGWLIVELGVALLTRRLRVGKQAAAAAFVVTVGGALVGSALRNFDLFIVSAVAGAYLLFAIKVVDQWEKAVVLRFGRFHAVRGPGMFWVVPFIDHVAPSVDGRVRTTAVHAEAALTRDAVPVHVDAVIFWLVWDVEKAVLEVQDFDRIVALVAQTALLESIGRHHLGDFIAERGALGRDLKEILEAKTTGWGITLQSVEIRDVRLPAALQDAMSRQAQAERERQARIIYGETETDLAHKFDEASVAYKDDPVALHLRAMNMLFEAIKEKGTMVVVPTGGLTRPTGRARARRTCRQ